jgi:hypothetical protein
MKRLCLLATLVALAACSDTPTQAPLDVRPQFATVVGSGATWAFKGHVQHWYDGPGWEGAAVQGTVQFTITGEDILPADPCAAQRPARSTFTYTVQDDATTYTLTGDGTAISQASCSGGEPFIQIDATPGSAYWYLKVHNPADGEDFPLTPPALGDSLAAFSTWDYNAREGFDVLVTELTAVPTNPQPKNPRTKADCMKGGWEKYGFKNQGQCVRYIETGKDSR